MSAKSGLVGLIATISLGSISFAAGAPSAKPTDTATVTATAIFAGGCFWCIEADFEKLPGVLGAESGYTAGRIANPTYEQVSAGNTGHGHPRKLRSREGELPAVGRLLLAAHRPNGEESAILRCRNAVSQWHLLAK